MAQVRDEDLVAGEESVAMYVAQLSEAEEIRCLGRRTDADAEPSNGYVELGAQIFGEGI